MINHLDDVTECSKHKNGKHLNQKRFFSKKVLHDLDELSKCFLKINRKLRKYKDSSIKKKYVNCVYSSLYALQEIKEYSESSESPVVIEQRPNILRELLNIILYNIGRFG